MTPADILAGMDEEGAYHGSLDLSGYALPLPAGLTNVGGNLYGLKDYAHPLPAGLTSVGGGLYLYGYAYPLPAGLTSVGGGLYLRGYAHPLPTGLASVGGTLDLRGYALPLPARLTSVGGSLDLDGYAHPLPAGLTSVGGHLYLSGYAHPLPAGLTSVGGNLILDGYAHPLPAGLTSVGGGLYLRGYAYPLPAGLTSVGGNLHLDGYTHPLPAGLTSVGGDLYLSGYKHPLPAGLAVEGEIFGADSYSFPLPVVESFGARAYGKQSAAMLKLRKPETPHAARDFKRMYPTEFEALKSITQGRDFAPEVVERLRYAYESPVEWMLTTGKYRGNAQRLCPGPNEVLKFNIRIDSEQYTADQRDILDKIRETSKRSGHPVEKKPFFTIGWVRYCVDDAAKTWLIEEVQSDVQGVRKGLKDPAARRQLEAGGLPPERVDEAVALVHPYSEHFYEDALGVVFDLAQQKGYRVEMLEYGSKREMGSPRNLYTDLPKSMGMRLGPGSAVLPSLQQTWKITPNKRRTSRKPSRRKTSRRR